MEIVLVDLKLWALYYLSQLGLENMSNTFLVTNKHNFTSKFIHLAKMNKTIWPLIPYTEWLTYGTHISSYGLTSHFGTVKGSNSLRLVQDQGDSGNKVTQSFVCRRPIYLAL